MNKSNEERIKFANDELFGKGNLDAVDQIFAPDYIVHAGNKDYKGHEIIKKFVGQIRTAIPGICVGKVTLLTQADDMITWQRTFSGKHIENMMGIPPTGKKVQWQDMVVTRFEEGKIVEEWTVSELAGQLLLKSPLV